MNRFEVRMTDFRGNRLLCRKVEVSASSLGAVITDVKQNWVPKGAELEAAEDCIYFITDEGRVRVDISVVQ